MDKANDITFMKEHLYYAMTFEKYQYLWTNALSFINKKIKDNDANETDCVLSWKTTEMDLSEMNEKHSKERKRILRKLRILRSIITVLAVIIILLTTITIVSKGKFPIILMFASDFILVGIILEVLYKKAAKEKRTSISFNDKALEHQRSILEKNIQNYDTVLVNIRYKSKTYKNIQAEISTQLDSVTKYLEDIYSFECITLKYRNLPATATMYEYLETRRYNIISGHGGIYDTYETEVRQERAIALLEQIDRKIDIVIENQKRLIEIVEDCRGYLAGIKSEINSISEKTSRIEANTAITAAAAQQALAYISYQQW